MGAIAKARTLRKIMTPAEARLWSALKLLRPCGLHFRRQAPLRGYILDFACLDRRVVVEVDGDSHLSEDRARRDRVRDAVLAREGYRTLRIPNWRVRDELGQVVGEVRMICLALPTRLARCASHPPPEGEGEAVVP